MDYEGCWTSQPKLNGNLISGPDVAISSGGTFVAGGGPKAKVAQGLDLVLRWGGEQGQ